MTSLKKKAKAISERLDKIEGIQCNAVQGAMYAFPKINLPPEAIAWAKVEPVFVFSIYMLTLFDRLRILNLTSTTA